MPEQQQSLAYKPLEMGEWKWLLAFLGFICLLTSLPYLLAYGWQEDAYQFSGFVFAVEDGNSYLAKMLAGSQGNWLFKTPYTSQDQKGVLMFLPYMILGKLAAPPGMHVQLIALYHLFRMLSTAAYVIASYQFIAWFIREIHLRRLGVLLASLGGGLGWVLLAVKHDFSGQSLPLEFYSPETFGFLGIYGLPHLALARACLLWSLLSIFLWMAEPLNTKKAWRLGLQLSFFWFLAGIAQPLTFVLIGYLIILYIISWVVLLEKGERSLTIRDLCSYGVNLWKRKLYLILVSSIFPVFVLIYQFWMLKTDAFLQAWSEQNLILSPHPVYYFWAYGLFIPYAILGWKKLFKTDQAGSIFLGVWILTLPILAYFPFNLQRRLPEGIWMAWVVLTLASLSYKSQKTEAVNSAISSGSVQSKVATDRLINTSGVAFKPKSGVNSYLPSRQLEDSQSWPRRLAGWGLCLAFPSTILLLWMGILAAKHPAPPVFLPALQVDAYEQLALIAKPDQVVLSAYPTGNALPAYAPLRVVIGHGPESADLEVLMPQVSAFYEASTSEQARLQFLCENQVDYFIWGHEERVLGDWIPHESPNLWKVYQNREVQIFRVEVTCP